MDDSTDDTRQGATPGRILVTGATGDVGGHLVDALQAQGASFAAMCRRDEQLERFEARGIDAVHGDLGDPASLRSAMDGVEQLFLLAPESSDQLAMDRRAIDAAVAAGVRHVVKLSTADANPRSAIPWARDHARCGRE